MADEEKLEEPTPRKRAKAAEDGQQANSQDLTALAVLGAGCAGFVMSFSILSRQLVEFTAGTLGDLGQPISSKVGTGFVSTAAVILCPMMACVVVASLLTGVAQAGVRFKLKPPKWEVLNPLPGLKKIFGSSESLIKLAFSMVKIVALGWICFGTLSGWIFGFLQNEPYTIMGILSAASEVAMLLILRLSVAMAILAVIDYLISYFQNEKQLRMSKQEIKDENKQSDGSPEVKSARKRKQFEMAQQRSIRNVPEADVVVVNPTHYAVALAYDRQRMDAPRVVAKGGDVLADRIRAVARRSGVPILSRPPLARALYRQVRIGQSIPGELYNAVAAVLAYVYQINRDRSAS